MELICMTSFIKGSRVPLSTLIFDPDLDVCSRSKPPLSQCLSMTLIVIDSLLHILVSATPCGIRGLLFRSLPSRLVTLVLSTGADSGACSILCFPKTTTNARFGVPENYEPLQPLVRDHINRETIFPLNICSKGVTKIPGRREVSDAG
jgi:hypothetical protein